MYPNVKLGLSNSANSYSAVLYNVQSHNDDYMSLPVRLVSKNVEQVPSYFHVHSALVSTRLGL